MYKKYISLCSKCKRINECPVCFLSNPDAYTFCCKKNDSTYRREYIGKIVSLLEANPSKYIPMINSIIK